MELAERVKILEQEVDILKNQIQATLLNIQEQLLTNKYPSIRSQEGNDYQNHSDSGSGSIQTFKHLSDGTSAPANVQRIPVQEVQNNVQADAYLLPSPPEEYIAQEEPAQNIEIELDWTTLADLEDWACNKVDRLGPERTRSLIRKYAHQGRFDTGLEKALLDLVAVYAEEQQYQKSGSDIPPFSPVPEFEDAYEFEVGDVWSTPLEPDYNNHTPHVKKNDNGYNIEILQSEPPRTLILKLIDGIRNAGNS